MVLKRFKGNNMMNYDRIWIFCINVLSVVVYLALNDYICFSLQWRPTNAMASKSPATWQLIQQLVHLRKHQSTGGFPSQGASSVENTSSSQWRHNEPHGVSDHQPYDCLPNRLFSRRSKETSKLRVTGLRGGNSPVTGEFPAQRVNNAENVSI